MYTVMEPRRLWSGGHKGRQSRDIERAKAQAQALKAAHQAYQEH